ncbi:hypothetical protein DIURU_002722 [Diutina rugosa]|uniref:SET domain-containing protein n=1 Tax=Diutina rugosa TaxID=5481 RepID=A0A642UTY1_DIURU|nr:uncharacterized protein DIURU_002722 [Diutina rugosa]KAA8902826.1 hypothetical protein DIURU_002722 [Diutina rugosa]
MEAFEAWINHDDDNTHSKSFICPQITVQESSVFGRGLFALEDLDKPQLIIRIPHRLLVNFTTVVKHICRYIPHVDFDQHPLYASINRAYEPPELSDDAAARFYRQLDIATLEALSSFQVVSLFLIVESSRPHSVWQPFLAMLPQLSDFDAVPLVWTIRDNQPQWHKRLPPSAQAHAAKVEARFDEDWQVVSKLTSQRGYTIQKLEYLRYWMCINSRCLYMDIPQGTTTADNFTLAPYVDFINHTDSDQCRLKIDGKGFQVFTSTPYKKGDQLFFSYGPHSNEFLMCEYGFITPTNKWNTLDITHHILPEVSSRPAWKEWLQDNDYWGEYTISSDGAASFRTEMALAVVQEPHPEQSRRLQAFVSGYTDGAVYERYTHRRLREVLESVISAATTELEKPPLPGFAGDCVKQIWQDQWEIAKTALTQLKK